MNDQETNHRIEMIKTLVGSILDNPTDLGVHVLYKTGSIRLIRLVPWSDPDYARLIGKKAATWLAISAIVDFLFKGSSVQVQVDQAPNVEARPEPRPPFSLKSWERLFLDYLEAWIGRPWSTFVIINRQALPPTYQVRTGQKLNLIQMMHVSRFFQTIAKHQGGLTCVRLED